MIQGFSNFLGLFQGIMANPVFGREMGPLISGKSRLVKYYSICPDNFTDRWCLVFWKSNERELFIYQKILGDSVDGQNPIPVGR